MISMTDEVTQPTELEVLKNRARMMGIEFSNNIGLESLKKRIEDKTNGDDQNDNENEPQVNALTGETEDQSDRPLTHAEIRAKIIAENMKLVRVRITNMNSAKKDLPGEIFTVGNEYVGTIKKFIPYGEATNDGYHISNILYKALARRKFNQIKTVKDKITGKTNIHTNWAREFAIEVLPPLSKQELAELKKAQAAAGSVQQSAEVN